MPRGDPVDGRFDFGGGGLAVRDDFGPHFGLFFSRCAGQFDRLTGVFGQGLYRILYILNHDGPVAGG